MECLFFYSAVLTKSVTFAPFSASMQRAMFNHWTVFALLLLPALFFYPCHSQCGGEYWYVSQGSSVSGCGPTVDKNFKLEEFNLASSETC